VSELSETRSSSSAYRGYVEPHRGGSDELLVRTSRGTACGEYLRRYWQPVALASEIEDVPRLIRVMGEELVIFRDKSGRYGLVHKQCPHRRASMEFGICDERGIRCCYHGWLFDVDGSVLEIPGQPEDIAEVIKAKASLGAYPVREFRGLVFAYLGPFEDSQSTTHSKFQIRPWCLTGQITVVTGCRCSMRSWIRSTPAFCTRA